MDDVIIEKAASIERYLVRIKEEYDLAGENFDTDYSHQDAAILNLQRACEQSIDLSNHIIRVNKWGVPSSSRESFDILVEKEFIPVKLGESLKKMVGFRNIAIHEYGRMNIVILKKIILDHLGEFKKFITIGLKSEL